MSLFKNPLAIEPSLIDSFRIERLFANAVIKTTNNALFPI